MSGSASTSTERPDRQLARHVVTDRAALERRAAHALLRHTSGARWNGPTARAHPSLEGDVPDAPCIPRKSPSRSSTMPDSLHRPAIRIDLVLGEAQHARVELREQVAADRVAACWPRRRWLPCGPGHQQGARASRRRAPRRRRSCRAPRCVLPSGRLKRIAVTRRSGPGDDLAGRWPAAPRARQLASPPWATCIACVVLRADGADRHARGIAAARRPIVAAHRIAAVGERRHRARPTCPHAALITPSR